MKEIKRQAAMLGLLSLLIQAPSVLGQNPPPPLHRGVRAPAFATMTIQGKPLTLQSLRGKVVLLDFWATWCGPCQFATPMLESLYKTYGNQGFTVVGMSLDDDRSIAIVKPYMKHFGITYPITVSPAANGNAQAAYNAQYLPSQYLIDKRGRVRWCQAGFSLIEAKTLPRRIRRLLAHPRS